MFCDQTPTSWPGVWTRWFGCVTCPGVECVLPALGFGWTPDRTVAQLWGADWLGVPVLVVLCCVGGRGASASVWTDVLETVGSFVAGWFVALGYLATRWRSRFLKAAVCGPWPEGACAVWGQWGAEARPGAPPVPCTAILTSRPSGGHGAFARSLPTRPVQFYVFHFTLLPGRYFSKYVPWAQTEKCSVFIWEILGFLVAGLLRAFKMVVMRWAVFLRPRLPLQACELDHAQSDTTSLVLYCPSGVASSQLSPLGAGLLKACRVCGMTQCLI